MYLPLGTYSPEIKLGLVSASRNCFPRSLSEERTVRLIEGCNHAGINLFVPQGACCIIETKDHASEAARQFKEAGCDAVVYYLGNFSPEIEDAFFVKASHRLIQLASKLKNLVCLTFKTKSGGSRTGEKILPRLSLI
jgi:L-fucose isomerase-like protein